jgi:hypothetical protein
VCTLSVSCQDGPIGLKHVAVNVLLVVIIDVLVDDDVERRTSSAYFLKENI